MNKIKLVIFDFDDTLCLTQKSGFKLENTVAKEMGFPPVSLRTHKNTWGRPLPDIATIRFPGINVDIFMKKVSHAMQNLSLKGDFDVVTTESLSIIREMINENRKVAVLTSRTKSEVIHILKKSHPLSSVIKKSEFFYRERTRYSKPDPRVFNEVLKYFSIDANKALYVGDSASDAVCAKMAGLRFVVTMESKLMQKSRFVENTVDGFIDNLKFLPNEVRKLENARLAKNKSFSSDKIKVIMEIAGQKISVPHDYFMLKFPEAKLLAEQILKST